ncbi:deoxyguanosinetriphosphate triphosphohydrolase family protein [Candidatus Formimonas warabiya]|uniref:HD domain-containing protein n=1 Tax=Formimonas warabiya TaxID=1761012 RepID=A0A3G1KQH9_FORW1|nr:hypothetical protein DCMF_07990 [Candidatus Formimonas warabiya]
MVNRVNDYLWDYSELRPDERQIRRQHEIPKCHDFRTDFSRDRDRIMFSRAFRRLGGKTQIFLANYHDHARNRLTHSLEVSKIARTICKCFNLDVDLAEAIALGHDLGHPPFGHSGEEALSMIMNGCIPINGVTLSFPHLGFKHNLQSVRIAVDLERSLNRNRGLNITNFTLYGIANHTDSIFNKCRIKKRFDENGQKIDSPEAENFCKIGDKCFKEDKIPYWRSTSFYKIYRDSMRLKDSDKKSWSFESFIVAFSDEIAQRQHDIEDALEVKIITVDQVIDILDKCFANIIRDDPINRNNFDQIIENKHRNDLTSDINRFIFNLYLSDLIRNVYQRLSSKFSGDKSEWAEIKSHLTVKEAKSLIAYSEEFRDADKKFHEFLRDRIVQSSEVQRMDGIGIYIIKHLFEAYLANPLQLPDKTIVQLYKTCKFDVVDKMYEETKDSYKDKYLSNYKDLIKIQYQKKFDETLSRKIDDWLLPDFFIHDSELIPKVVGNLRNLLITDQTDNNFKPFLMRTICDYISGMTDSYAINEFHNLYGHKCLQIKMNIK